MRTISGAVHRLIWPRAHVARPLAISIGLSLLLVTLLGSLAVPPAARAVPIGNRIPWNGNNWYLHGANVPWYNWACDFGCGTSSGVSASSVQTALAPTFAQARTANMHVIRWWVFEGSPWQVTRDAGGVPTGMNPAIYADFDAALALAETYDLYYDFVLFSAPTALPSSWLTDATQRAALANALAPLFSRYAGNPRVLSWEVFNEPEWDVWNNKIDQASVQATVRAIAGAVHTNSSAYVTVGSAMLDGLPMWLGQGLDYYQAHWYDYMSGGNYCAICWTYAQVQSRYNLDAPLVIGEFYAGPDVDALGRFNYWYQNGYAGGWSWSMFPSHTSDQMAIDWAAATTFGSQHSDLGPRTGLAALTPTPTTTRTPSPTASVTSTSTLTPQPTGTRTATSTPTASASPSGTSTPTVTATATRSLTPTTTPTPRGNGRHVHLAVAPAGNGSLQVTVTADTSDCASSNQLTALQFGNSALGTDAVVDLPQLTGISVVPPLAAAANFEGRRGSFTVNWPAGTQQATFTVRRLTANQPTTLPFTVIDGCGTWPTFVGGGSSAF
jgi:hypothetical protein